MATNEQGTPVDPDNRRWRVGARRGGRDASAVAGPGVATVHRVVLPGCEAVIESISARLDGESAPLPRATVDRHLAACRRCARLAAGLPSLAQLVAPAAAERPAPPARRRWALRGRHREA